MQLANWSASFTCQMAPTDSPPAAPIGLGYRSQRETPRDRLITRAFKLKDRLKGKAGIGDYIPKPKWMRWRTYEREIARIEKAEEINNADLWALVQRLQAKRL
jgi:hypothetical protein